MRGARQVGAPHFKQRDVVHCPQRPHRGEDQQRHEVEVGIGSNLERSTPSQVHQLGNLARQLPPLLHHRHQLGIGSNVGRSTPPSSHSPST